MNTEYLPIAPKALEPGILDRVEDFVTGKQMNTLAAHLATDGIVDAINQRLTEQQFDTLGGRLVASGVTKQFGDKTGRKPWTAVMNIVDEVEFAASEPHWMGH